MANVATYAAETNGTITHLSGPLDSDLAAQTWHRELGNPGTLVVLDLAEGETPKVGDSIDIDADGVATLRKSYGANFVADPYSGAWARKSVYVGIAEDMNNSTQVTQVNIYKSGASWFGARWAGAEFDGCDPIEADDEAEAIAQACLEFPGANITRADDER